MRETPPDILLTNYAQLEYILLRGRDAELFRYGPPRYLVVDEIHLFTGVLGAEVGCLLRRFRQHVGARPSEICAVGTSATAGVDEQPRLVEFAGRLFGARFDADCLISEIPAPVTPRGVQVPSLPSLTPMDLAAATDDTGLAALAAKVFGIELPDNASFAESLGGVINRFGTVGAVEDALDAPGPLQRAAEALAELPERAGVAMEALELEAMAIVLLGAAARLRPVGEQEPVPRFRPRLHQVVRSLAGLWRCLRPACGTLVAPGTGLCPECGASARAVATCRTCGEAYWVGRVQVTALEDIDRVPTTEPQRGDQAVFLADPDQLKPIEEDEEGGKVRWDRVTICPECARITPGHAPLVHDRSCPAPTAQGVTLLASIDSVHCPSCGDLGARDRPILLPLKGSAAASVAVLTHSLSEELRSREGEAGGRLLVFADSRQDAAQQAGYADDQGSRVSIRQLVRSSLEDGPLSLSAAASRVISSVLDDKATLRRWLIGESDRRFDEVSDPDYEPSTEDEKQIRSQLEWETVLECTERARRRFSLEREGLVVVGVDRLDETVDVVTRGWDHPFRSKDHVREAVYAVVDVMRYARAVDHFFLSLQPATLRRNHSIRIGDRAVQATRGWAESKFKTKEIDIRAWTNPRHVTRMNELFGRMLQVRPTQANEIVEHLASRLQAAGLFTHKRVENRKRLMVDHKRLVLSLRDEEQLWRCDRCGSVRSVLLTDLSGDPLCVNWRCPGRPQPFQPPAEHSFYRRQYEARPRRLIVREHSGQVEADERISLERRFNDQTDPTVDVIACTPTLEVGVSLDDLHAIILRNLPPAPANYAQRVGRAGRRSKVALAFAHAGHGPHDSYFFERPEEMIHGLVRAPAISLDNEPLLRRHLNSLIMETLGIDLPSQWVPPLDEEGFGEETVATEDGVIKESTLRPFEERLADLHVKRAVTEAILGAFASSQDPSAPAAIERLGAEQVEGFVENLRSALNRWCERYRALLEELRRMRSGTRVPSRVEKDVEDRLFAEVRRMASPRSLPEHQPLGFLGLVGFLPRYGFTGESVLLHPPRGEEPIAQSGSVAVTEFAPGNMIYARGRRLKVHRLDPPPVPEGEGGVEHRQNVLRRARRCDDCEFLTFDLLQRACPDCEKDLVGQGVVELTGVRGSGGAISSEDEYRARSYYDVAHVLGTPPEPPEILTIGGLTCERTAGREITVANRGPAAGGDEPAGGFDICTGCGYAIETREHEEEDEEAEARGHAPRCPGRKDPEVVRSGVWLTARIKGDVMEVVLPEATRQRDFASWRLTLAEALKFGVRESMQAGQRDLGSFERLRGGAPYSIVIYDTMPGGTGYIPKLFADGGEGLKVAAATALQRLEDCDCSGSCHRCLREFWNQRFHERLNRFEVIGVLRRLAEGHATQALDPENEKLESFLESEFFARLRAAGLPTPTLQVVRQLGGALIQRVGAEWRPAGSALERRGIITRVDAEYRDPDVSIFLDGRAYHALSVEKIADDLDKRNRLEERDVLVLEFTYRDVMEYFDGVIDAIRRALSKDTADPSLGGPAGIPGLKLVAADDQTKRATVAVDPLAWRKDEAIRQEALSSANRLRLSGWRLKRIIDAPTALLHPTPSKNRR